MLNEADPSDFLRWRLWSQDEHDGRDGRYLASIKTLTLSGFVEYQPYLWGGEQDEALTLSGMVEHGYPRHPAGPWWVCRWDKVPIWTAGWRRRAGYAYEWRAKWEPWNGWKGELCASKLWPDIRDLVV